MLFRSSSFPNVAIMEYELNTFGHLEEVRNYIEQSGNDYSKVAQNVGEFRRHAVKAMTERLDYSADEASEFLKSAVNKYDNLSPSVLAEHCVDYTRETGKRLVFIVDEIGQYVISLKDMKTEYWPCKESQRPSPRRERARSG